MQQKYIQIDSSNVIQMKITRRKAVTGMHDTVCVHTCSFFILRHYFIFPLSW